MITQTCKVCNQEKPREAYYGYLKTCKVCYNRKCQIWKNANPEASKRNSRAQNKKRRAIMYGVEADLIHIETLYIRDNGICQLCGEACDRLDATMDHKKPLSKGGTHTWDNVQLAHMVCNRRKGNKE